MNRLTTKQQSDIESIMYFAPATLPAPNNEDILAFLKTSERGVIPENQTPGYETLIEGKRWRGIHMYEMYEEGVLEGSMPYWVLLGGYSKKEIPPRSVVDFMKKSLFVGLDSEIIERVYKDVLWYWTPWYKKLYHKFLKIL